MFIPNLDEEVELIVPGIEVFKKPLRASIDSGGIRLYVEGSYGKKIEWEKLFTHEPRERDWRLSVDRMLRAGAIALSDSKPPAVHEAIKSAMTILGSIVIQCGK